MFLINYKSMSEYLQREKGNNWTRVCDCLQFGNLEQLHASNFI